MTQGELFNQKEQWNCLNGTYSNMRSLEGVDERIRQFLVDKEISIGDYVLTDGEIPAMVLIDCVARLARY